MPDRKSDSNDYGAQSGDRQRDLWAKGGPASGLGSPGDRHRIPKPFEKDLLTQMAVKNKSKKKKQNKK